MYITLTGYRTSVWEGKIRTSRWNRSCNMLHQNTRHFLKKKFLCYNSVLVETGAAWRNHAVNQIRDPFWEPTKRFDHKREINVPFWCNFVSTVFYFDWLGILIASKSLGDLKHYERILVAEGKWLRCQWPILFQMRNSGWTHELNFLKNLE